jgi:transposase-like protein
MDQGPECIGSSALLAIMVDCEASFAFVEQRRWRFGRTCPRCGVKERFGAVCREGAGAGQYKCYACRRFFTLRTGTSLEGSHLALNLWLAALYMMVATNGRVSLHVMSDLLGVTMQTTVKLRRQLMAICRNEPGSVIRQPPCCSAAPGDAEDLAINLAGEVFGPDSPRRMRERNLLAFLAKMASDANTKAFVTALDRLILPGVFPGACEAIATPSHDLEAGSHGLDGDLPLEMKDG